MKALLVRVGADKSPGGGGWNGPVDSATGEFVYVAIPENSPVHPGLEKPYSALTASLARFQVKLPAHLRMQHMHLDPDFAHLTYGDQRERAKQLQNYLKPGDRIIFYAGLADTREKGSLIYAIIGLFVVERFLLAVQVAPMERDSNAHSRRILAPDAQDLIVQARPEGSGRLKQCIPIGEYRNKAYRVRKELLNAWGGLQVKDGYLQRSARLPKFSDPERFMRWFDAQLPILIQANN